MIIGTAGHIDHGKSALLEALTGQRMDRLPAEQRRGITLDLGFASLPLEGGTLAGIVDVPGHEDLVRTMAAGASGMDMALLVVAADEGIMPQTEEHLLVLERLGVPCGIPVVTKVDLVQAEWLDLVTREVAARTVASPVRFTPPVAVSARTGCGLGELRAAINGCVSLARERSSEDLFRLPIDRAFTIAGAGTVVTGTAWSGAIELGAEVRILPQDIRGRVRSIETHGVPAERTSPGMRTALAVAGVERGAVGRGSVVVAASAGWRASTRADVEVELSPTARDVVRRTRVLVHAGTAESGGWLVPRGASGAARRFIGRLSLDRPVLLRGGDRFLLRAASPARVIGGGVVLDPDPPPRSKWEGEAGAGPVASLVRRRKLGVHERELPWLSGMAPRAAARMVDRSPELARIGDRIVAERTVREIGDRVANLVATFHEANPAERGISLETLRQSAGAPPWLAEAALRTAQGGGAIELDGSVVRRPGFRPRVSGGDAVVADVVRRIDDAGLTPPDAGELGAMSGRADIAAILRVAAGQGLIVAVERDRYFSRRALDGFAAVLRESGEGGEVRIPPLKERLGLTRKYLIPLLEWSDREGLTVRQGDIRRVATSGKAGTQVSK